MKKFFKMIGHFFSNLWHSLQPKLKQAVAIAVEVTNAIKEFDSEHPGAVDAITHLIPGKYDDAIVGRVREALPDIMIKLRLVQATEGLTDPNEIVKAGIAVLQSFDGMVKNTAYNSLVQFITDAAADGKLDWNDLAYLPKWLYDHDKDNEVDTTVEAPAE